MRIGLVSDSHGNIEMLKKAVDKMDQVDVIFHMGDYVEDALEIKKWINVPVFKVKGNMDTYSSEGDLFVKTELAGKTVLACHGHTENVKNTYASLYYKSLEEGADIALFGHTHIPVIEATDELFMMNPGSIALPHNGGDKTFGVITIEDGKIAGEIIAVE